MPRRVLSLSIMVFVLAVLGALLARQAHVADARSETITVTGTVYGTSDGDKEEPVADVRVLPYRDGSPLYSDAPRTASDGTYNFSVERGTYITIKYDHGAYHLFLEDQVRGHGDQSLNKVLLHTSMKLTAQQASSSSSSYRRNAVLKDFDATRAALAPRVEALRKAIERLAQEKTPLPKGLREDADGLLRTYQGIDRDRRRETLEAFFADDKWREKNGIGDLESKLEAWQKDGSLEEKLEKWREGSKRPEATPPGPR